MKDLFIFILILCGLVLGVGVFLTLLGAIVYIIAVDEWKEEHTEDVLAPLVVSVGLVITIATLGLPAIMDFLSKCKKLFWDKK